MTGRVFFISAMFFLFATYCFCGQAIYQEKGKPVKAMSPSLKQKAEPNITLHPESTAIPWDTGGSNAVVKPKASATSGAVEKAGRSKELLRINANKTKTASGIQQKTQKNRIGR